MIQGRLLIEYLRYFQSVITFFMFYSSGSGGGGGGTPDPNGRQFTPGGHKSQMIRQQAMLTGQNGLLPENVIWTYVIQMTSALRHIHSGYCFCSWHFPAVFRIFCVYF